MEVIFLCLEKKFIHKEKRERHLIAVNIIDISSYIYIDIRLYKIDKLLNIPGICKIKITSKA